VGIDQGMVNAEMETQHRGSLIAVEDTRMGPLARLIDVIFPYALIAVSILIVLGLSILIYTNIHDLPFMIPAIIFIILFAFMGIWTWKATRSGFPNAFYPSAPPLRIFEKGIEIPMLLHGGPDYPEKTIFCHFNEIEDIRFDVGVGVVIIRNGNALQFHLPSMENDLSPSMIKNQWEQFKRNGDMQDRVTEDTS